MGTCRSRHSLLFNAMVCSLCFPWMGTCRSRHSLLFNVMNCSLPFSWMGTCRSRHSFLFNVLICSLSFFWMGACRPQYLLLVSLIIVEDEWQQRAFKRAYQFIIYYRLPNKKCIIIMKRIGRAVKPSHGASYF